MRTNTDRKQGRARSVFRAAWGVRTLAAVLFAAAGCEEPSTDPAGRDMSTPPANADQSAAVQGSVVVNEIFPHGADERTDPDWVELKNTGGTPIALSGYRVRDDKTPSVLPSGTTIPAGGYLLIYCDDAPDGGATDRIHVPFKLGAKDEFYLLDAAGNRVDSIAWDSTTALSGKSYGRLPDGTGQFNALTPTPGARNGT